VWRHSSPATRLSSYEGRRIVGRLQERSYGAQSHSHTQVLNLNPCAAACLSRLDGYPPSTAPERRQGSIPWDDWAEGYRNLLPKRYCHERTRPARHDSHNPWRHCYRSQRFQKACTRSSLPPSHRCSLMVPISQFICPYELSTDGQQRSTSPLAAWGGLIRHASSWGGCDTLGVVYEALGPAVRLPELPQMHARDSPNSWPELGGWRCRSDAPVVTQGGFQRL